MQNTHSKTYPMAQAVLRVLRPFTLLTTIGALVAAPSSWATGPTQKWSNTNTTNVGTTSPPYPNSGSVYPSNAPVLAQNVYTSGGTSYYIQAVQATSAPGCSFVGTGVPPRGIHVWAYSTNGSTTLFDVVPYFNSSDDYRMFPIGVYFDSASGTVYVGCTYWAHDKSTSNMLLLSDSISNLTSTQVSTNGWTATIFSPTNGNNEDTALAMMGDDYNGGTLHLAMTGFEVVTGGNAMLFGDCAAGGSPNMYLDSAGTTGCCLAHKLYGTTDRVFVGGNSNASGSNSMMLWEFDGSANLRTSQHYTRNGDVGDTVTWVMTSTWSDSTNHVYVTGITQAPHTGGGTENDTTTIGYPLNASDDLQSASSGWPVSVAGIPPLATPWIRLSGYDGPVTVLPDTTSGTSTTGAPIVLTTIGGAINVIGYYTDGLHTGSPRFSTAITNPRSYNATATEMVPFASGNGKLWVLGTKWSTLFGSATYLVGELTLSNGSISTATPTASHLSAASSIAPFYDGTNDYCAITGVVDTSPNSAWTLGYQG